MLDSYYELTQDQRQNKTASILTKQGRTDLYPSHFHKKMEITYVVTGYVNTMSAGTSHKANTDEIIFVPKFTPHSYSTSKDAQRLVFLPTTSLLSDVNIMFEQKTLPFVLTNRDFNREKILPILHDFSEISQNNTLPYPYMELCLKGLTNLLFGRLLEEYYSLLQDNPTQTDLVFNIHSYIDQHFHEDITLDNIAKHFGYNKYYFSKLFNSLFSISLNNYINNVRISKFIEKAQKAKNLQSTITNLAYDCGFNSMPPFYRTFQNIYHCSPNEYFKK